MRRSGAANRAFSLIELLVVLAIVGILVAIVTPNFLGLRARSALNEGAQSLARDIERVRLDARRVNDEASISVDSGANAYTVTLANGAVTTVSLPQGVIVDVDTSPLALTFMPPYGTIAPATLDATSGAFDIDLVWTGAGAAPQRTVAVAGVMGKVIVR